MCCFVTIVVILQGLLSGKVDLKSLAAIGEVLKALPPPPQGMQMPRLDQVGL
jgi:hypothetical protein